MVAGYAGVVTGDGSSFTGLALTQAGTARESPGLVGRPSGAASWSVVDTAFLWHGEFEVPPVTVSDAAGILYTAFPFPTDAATGATAPGLLMAVDPAARAIAFDVATGATAWATAPGDRARLLSVGRGGRVYVAIGRPGHTAIRGLRLRDGATAWQRRTNQAVQGASERADGTVAVSVGWPSGSWPDDRLTLLDPRG